MAYRSNLLVDLVVGLLCLLVACQLDVKGEDEIQATCTIEAGSGVAPIYGTVKLRQKLTSWLKSRSDIEIEIILKGFNRSASVTGHGIHVHEFGSVGRKCNDSGAHYNPYNKTHGAPSDSERHVGDLGNFGVDSNGEVNFTRSDHLISLFGERSVINRSFVVHERSDDFGREGFSDSQTTGHEGARFGCCVIQKTTVSAGNRWSEVQSTVVALLFLASLISIY